jgi:hypothetical protein
MPTAAERRHFWRAAFRSSVLIIGPAAAAEAELLDISLKGALVELPSGWKGKLGDSCRLELRLADDAVIAMEAVVTHLEDRRAGLRCQRIDLESITHLRRLVELNAGDPALLERELQALLET